MVAENGSIRVYLVDGGGYDENGDPIPATDAERLGDPIPCNWSRNNYENKGTYEDGKFTAANYEIVLPMMDFRPCRFNLYDKDGTLLSKCEAHERGIVRLRYINSIKVTV